MHHQHYSNFWRNSTREIHEFTDVDGSPGDKRQVSGIKNGGGMRRHEYAPIDTDLIYGMKSL